MDDSERIEHALEITGWTQAELARRLTEHGVPMTADKVNKVLKNTRGLKAIESEKIAQIISEAEYDRDAEPVRQGEVLIPEFDIRAAAGYGFIIDEETVKDQWPFARSYLNELRIQPSSAVIIEVGGDSMEPTLRSTDRVMVDTGDTNPARPGVFLVWDSGAAVVKRVELIPATEPAQFRLSSDNPHHGEYEVRADMVNVVGRVVWFARRL